MPSSPDSIDQQDYWNTNIDPKNLGTGFEVSRFDYRTELAYYLTPDQRDALAALEPLRGSRLLEVGAGLGTNTLYMARAGATVVAIDIARERLRTLGQLAAGMGIPGGEGGTAGQGDSQPSVEQGRVWLVQCSADALPFRTGTFDRAYSKSVLIHTKLEQSVPELRRALRPGGVGAFIEPLTRNPLVNLYRRTLAPREWRFITRYFAEPEIGLFRQVFGNAEVRRYYLGSFAAFTWQFAVRAPRLFRVSLTLLNGVDRTLTALVPGLGRYAWFALIRVEKRGADAQVEER